MPALSTLWNAFSPRRRQLRAPLFSKWRRAGSTPGFVTAGRTAKTLRIDDFRRAPAWRDRIDHLHQAFQLAPASGQVLEFGVHKGSSVNWLAKWSQGRAGTRVFGFDSFEGLPEAWVRTRAGQRYEEGHFALPGLPPVEPNVELVPGFFDATLPRWLETHEGPVAFLHNDSDLYSSTLTTLTLLNERIVPGSVMVFDELCDWSGSGAYDNWEQGEWQALLEWMARFQREITVVSRDERFSAAVLVTR